MKATHADPPCWGQHSDPERSRPPRGEQSWSLSKSLYDMSRAQGDDASTEQGRWHAGNVFESLDQGEQAYDQEQSGLASCAPGPCLTPVSHAPDPHSLRMLSSLSPAYIH